VSKVQNEIRKLLERMWDDLASQPWTDENYAKNQQWREKSKAHFVGATLDDITKVVEDHNGKTADRETTSSEG
jgi:hypothetical protein